MLCTCTCFVYVGCIRATGLQEDLFSRHASHSTCGGGSGCFSRGNLISRTQQLTQLDRGRGWRGKGEVEGEGVERERRGRRGGEESRGRGEVHVEGEERRGRGEVEGEERRGTCRRGGVEREKRGRTKTWWAALSR